MFIYSADALKVYESSDDASLQRFRVEERERRNDLCEYETELT